MQLLERWAGLEPEFADERATRVRVGLEGLRLAPGAVERSHQLGAQALTKRMLTHEHAELRDELSVPAQEKIGLDPFFDRIEALVVYFPARGSLPTARLPDRRAGAPARA